MIKQAIGRWFRKLGHVYTMTDWARESRGIATQQREDDKRFVEILSLLSLS